MSGHYEVRVSGSGGQGLMVLGDILAEAVGNYENKELILTKSYGPESRGGLCRAELIIDDTPINYPEVRKPDFVLALTQLSCDRYHRDMHPDGVLLVDPMFVRTVPEGVKNVYSIPLTEIAKNITGREIAANVAAIGAMSVLGKFVELDSLKKAMRDHFPQSLHESNEKVFNAGAEAARALL